MAARLRVKRAKIFARFSLSSATRTFCVAVVKEEKGGQDTVQRKKKKEKDLEKALEYEQYRDNVQNACKLFRVEHEKRQEKERRRLEKLNLGSFSPLEQHKKAAEIVRKYNEKKEMTRKVQQGEQNKRMKIQLREQKTESDARQLERNRELVLQVIDESKSFVTMENLEEKIENVLSTETNYNFALTADLRKLMSQEPPNNLDMPGPGPAAYSGVGLQFRTRTQLGKWKTRQFIEDDFLTETDLNESDATESSNSDLQSNDDHLEEIVKDI